MKKYKLTLALFGTLFMPSLLATAPVKLISKEEQNKQNNALLEACGDEDHDRDKDVKQAIRKGANINIQRAIDGYTPLMIACSVRSSIVVNLLLTKYHADIFIENKKERTVLDIVLAYISEDGVWDEKYEYDIINTFYGYLTMLIEVGFLTGDKAAEVRRVVMLYNISSIFLMPAQEKVKN